MRIVRHPNIVELKAFYYSNGDRVCVVKSFPSAFTDFTRKMRSISISSSNSSPKPSTAPHDTSTR